MKYEDYQEITAKIGEIMSMLEYLETILIDRFGSRCHTAVWVRLTSCYLVLTNLKFSQEYNNRFVNDQGGWSLTD